MILEVSTNEKKTNYMVKVITVGKKQILGVYNIFEDFIALKKVYFHGDAYVNYMGFTRKGFVMVFFSDPVIDIFPFYFRYQPCCSCGYKNILLLSYWLCFCP